MKKLLAIFALTTSTLLAQQGGIGPDWSSVDAPQGNFTELNSSSGSIGADSVTAGTANVGTITSTNDITILNGGIVIDGTGTNIWSMPWDWTDTNGVVIQRKRSVGGSVTNGDSITLQTIPVAEGEAIFGTAEVAAGAFGALLCFSAEYPSGGALAISQAQATIGTNIVTNLYADVSGGNVRVLYAAELSKIMYPTGAVSWVASAASATYAIPLTLGPIDFETTGAPTGDEAPYGSLVVDWDYSADPLEGSESLAVGTAGATGYAIWDLTPADEYYAAARVRAGVGVASGTGFISLYTNTTLLVGAKTYQSTDYRVQASNSGGTSTGVLPTITTNAAEFYYIMVRAQKGTGANAEAQVWMSTNGVSWHTNQTTSDGTWTNQINRVWFHKNTSAPEPFIFDKVVVDTNEIDISVLAP